MKKTTINFKIPTKPLATDNATKYNCTNIKYLKAVTDKDGNTCKGVMALSPNGTITIADDPLGWKMTKFVIFEITMSVPADWKKTFCIFKGTNLPLVVNLVYDPKTGGYFLEGRIKANGHVRTCISSKALDFSRFCKLFIVVEKDCLNLFAFNLKDAEDIDSFDGECKAIHARRLFAAPPAYKKNKKGVLSFGVEKQFVGELLSSLFKCLISEISITVALSSEKDVSWWVASAELGKLNTRLEVNLTQPYQLDNFLEDMKYSGIDSGELIRDCGNYMTTYQYHYYEFEKGFGYSTPKGVLFFDDLRFHEEFQHLRDWVERYPYYYEKNDWGGILVHSVLGEDSCLYVRYYSEARNLFYHVSYEEHLNYMTLRETEEIGDPLEAGVVHIQKDVFDPPED